MIEFKGEISSKCKKYLQNYSSRRAGFACLILTLIVGVIACVAAIFWHRAILLIIIAPLIMTVFAFIPEINAPLKVFNKSIPRKIVIENGIIEFSSDECNQYETAENVKCIFDFGDWYHIVFKFPTKSIYCVCQKDLLVQGTIEEFEAVFEGKIVRKKY